MAGLIWLASYPKSGNTWVRLFLENLMIDAVVPVNINAPKRCTVYESRSFWYSEVTGLRHDRIDYPTVIHNKAKVHRLITGLAEGGVLVKTHAANISVFDEPLITGADTAGAIYIVRNPLDVLLSYADFMGMSVDQTIRYMCEEKSGISGDYPRVVETVSSWTTHVESWTKHQNPRVLVVRYEDMLSDPLDVFGKITRHLRIEASQEAVERAVRHTGFDVLHEQEVEGGFEESFENRPFFRKGTAGQWRDALTEKAIRVMVREHGATMRRFGYITDDMPPPPPRAPMRPRRPIVKLRCGLPLVPPSVLVGYEEIEGIETHAGKA